MASANLDYRRILLLLLLATHVTNAFEHRDLPRHYRQFYVKRQFMSVNSSTTPITEQQESPTSSSLQALSTLDTLSLSSISASASASTSASTSESSELATETESTVLSDISSAFSQLFSSIDLLTSSSIGMYFFLLFAVHFSFFPFLAGILLLTLKCL